MMKKKVFLISLKNIKKKKIFIYQKNVFNIQRLYFHRNLKKGYILSL